MTIEIISLIVVGFVVLFFLRREQAREDRYFGKKRKYTKKEQAILDYYRSIYNPVPSDEKFPSLQRDGFEFEDISWMATQIVYDNPIPRREDIERVGNGDLVKLLFKDEDGYVERMWVEILERNGSSFKGLLRNDAVEFENLKDGTILHFHSNHIYQIDGDR